jgi:hypothetical protein
MALKSMLALAVVLAHQVLGQQVLRFGCSQLVIERIDPIVNPGMAPSAHTHQVKPSLISCLIV